MGFETPGAAEVPQAAGEVPPDIQVRGAELIDSADAVTTGQEKTKKFEDLSEEDKKNLEKSGAHKIGPSKSPSGKPSVAISFKLDARVFVKSGDKWRPIPATTVAHITVDDTDSVKVDYEQGPSRTPDGPPTHISRITINNSDGTQDVLETRWDL